MLVVDDQIGIRLLLEEVISQEGYKVEQAVNGKEALDSVKEQQPDLLVLDYKLPIINGYEVLKQLEEEGINVPTIVMSGLPDRAKEDMKEFQNVKAYSSKPFQLNDMRELVNSILAE